MSLLHGPGDSVTPQGKLCRFHQRSSCDGNSERWDDDLGKGEKNEFRKV